MDPHPSDPVKGSRCGDWYVAAIVYKQLNWSIMLLDDLDDPSAMLTFDGSGPITKHKYWLVNSQKN